MFRHAAHHVGMVMLHRHQAVEGRVERINALVTDFLWLAKSPPKAERVQPLPICEARSRQTFFSIILSSNRLPADYR